MRRTSCERARRLLDAAELVAEYPYLSEAALLLLGEAIRVALQARALGRDPLASDAPVAPSVYWSELEQTSSGARLLAELGASAAEHAREGVLGSSASTLPRLPQELEARLRALRRLAALLVAELEADDERLRRLLALRRLRVAVAALAVAALVLGTLFGLGLIGPKPNLALGKTVTASSALDAAAYPPAKLVDGNPDDLGLHTKLEDEPSVTLDLLEPLTIQRVVVVNRDEYRERAVPLIIETSLDGRTYREFGRRYELFGV